MRVGILCSEMKEESRKQSDEPESRREEMEIVEEFGSGIDNGIMRALVERAAALSVTSRVVRSWSTQLQSRTETLESRPIFLNRPQESQ